MSGYYTEFEHTYCDVDYLVMVDRETHEGEDTIAVYPYSETLGDYDLDRPLRLMSVDMREAFREAALDHRQSEHEAACERAASEPFASRRYC